MSASPIATRRCAPISENLSSQNIESHDELISEDEISESVEESNKCNRVGKIPVHLSGRKSIHNNDGSSTSKAAKVQQPSLKPCFYIAIPVLAVIVIFYNNFDIFTSTDNIQNPCVCVLQNLMQQFQTQDKRVWSSLNVSLSEIKDHSKPSVIIYVYNNIDENKLDNLLDQIASHANCVLRCDRKSNYINSNGKDFDTEIYRQDFGVALNKYRNDLKETPVMIVRNLDEVPGIVAQAFHYLTDEYEPAVAESLFLFTIRLDKFGQNNLEDFKLINKKLQQNWGIDLKDDIFYPLFTRISSLIIRLKPI